LMKGFALAVEAVRLLVVLKIESSVAIDFCCCKQS